ncbi:MAG: lactate utilization protein [Solirubrobacterales bacterium]
MDNNLKTVIDMRIKRTMDNLIKNNMDAFYAEDESKVLEKVKELLNDGDTVSVGGSMSLFETGVIDYLRCGKYNFLDRYENGLDAEGLKAVFRKSFFADAYFTSSNAVTENGELYNVDGLGNRTAAMIYGPDKVIVIVGVNKIVSDSEAAIERNRNCAAPANAIRLDRNTPCAKVGYCMDCSSAERICNSYVLIGRQAVKGRIKVIIVGKDYGY